MANWRRAVTLRPTVSTAVLASGVATLIIAVLEQYTNFHVTGAISGAIVGVCSFIAGWMVPNESS